MLKKIIAILCLTLVFSSCEKEHPKTYMSFSGKLENITEKDTVISITGSLVRKRVKVNSDGTFQDSLVISKPGYHTIFLSGARAYMHLKNGYDLEFTGDKNNFFKSFQFKGRKEGAQSNQLIVDQFALGQTAGNLKGFMLLDKQPFLNKINKYKTGMDSIANLYPKADKAVVDNLKGQNDRFFKVLTENYDKMHTQIVEEEKALAKLKKGMPAPQFSNFENYRGGKSSLSDFKGSYLYVDIWATWCKPCIVQIPYLEKLQKRYKGKNLKFLSISTDGNVKTAKTWKEARLKWRKMVKQKNLKGVQLWAGKENTLHKDYMIHGIPRFMIIDPDGNIVTHSARRPADPRLIKELDDLLK